MEFLKVLFIIVAFYYAFKFGVRLLFPILMKKMAEKLMKKAQNQANYRTQPGDSFRYQTFGHQTSGRDQASSKGSKVTVDYVPPREEDRKGQATAGEFIDFEEVK